MRLLLSVLLITVTTSVSFGQLRSYPVKKDRVLQIKEKLYVVTHNAYKEQNDQFINAVKKYWTFCKYEIVDENKVAEMFEHNDKVPQLHLFNGDFGLMINIPAIGITEKMEKRNTYGYTGYGAAYFWPINYEFNWIWNPVTSTESKVKEGSKLEKQGTEVYMALAIQRLNYFWSNTDDKKINATFVSQWKTINKTRGSQIKTKKLLVSPGAQLATLEKIKKVYDHPNMSFASGDEIANAILNQEDVLVVLYEIGLEKEKSEEMLIYHPATGKTFYNKTISKKVNKLPKLQLSFFKKINKAE